MYNLQLKFHSVCDLKNGKLLHTLEGHNKPVNCIQIDLEMDLLITADVGGIIMLWSISTGHCLHTLTGHTDESNHTITKANTISLLYETERTLDRNWIS